MTPGRDAYATCACAARPGDGPDEDITLEDMGTDKELNTPPDDSPDQEESEEDTQEAAEDKGDRQAGQDPQDQAGEQDNRYQPGFHYPLD